MNSNITQASLGVLANNMPQGQLSPSAAVHINSSPDTTTAPAVVSTVLKDGEVVLAIADGHVEQDLKRHSRPVLRTVVVTDRRLIAVDRPEEGGDWTLSECDIGSTLAYRSEDRPEGAMVVLHADWGVVHVQGIDRQHAEEFQEHLRQALIADVCANLQHSSGPQAVADYMARVNAPIDERRAASASIDLDTHDFMVMLETEHGVPVTEPTRT